jgi:hypothetical protein
MTDHQQTARAVYERLTRKSDGWHTMLPVIEDQAIEIIAAALREAYEKGVADEHARHLDPLGH